MLESHRNDVAESAGKSFTWMELASRWLGGSPVREMVQTRLQFEGGSEQVWRDIAFYEEIPGRAPFPLRLFMPIPVRAEGSKAKVGAVVRCVYTSGDLLKRMTVVEAPNLLRFEVLQQRVGIEGCAVAERGSYEIIASGASSNVMLTTQYRAYLRPRWFWRPIERLVTHQLHRHVLKGMRTLSNAANAAIPAPVRTV